MAKLLILITGSNLVAEYVGKDVLENAPTRANGSLTQAILCADSPNQPCVSVIVNSRQSCCMYGS